MKKCNLKNIDKKYHDIKFTCAACANKTPIKGSYEMRFDNRSKDIVGICPACANAAKKLKITTVLNLCKGLTITD